MMADEQQSKPRMGRWMRVLLIGSLTVNLLVAGLAVGAAWRFRDFDKMRPPPTVGTLLYREMSREDRKELRRHAWGDKGGFKQRRLNDGLAVAEALRQVPFDPEQLSQVLRAQSHAREQFQQKLQQTWVARLSEMSDAERADYADRLEERIRKGRDHHRKK